jgi:tetratricopeptide (TPR) repeat protein
MRSRWLIAIIVAWSLSSGNNVEPAATSPLSEGNELEYNLDFDEALTRFREAVEAQPEDPAALRAVAAAHLFQIVLRRGVITIDDLLGDELAADSVSLPKPPVEFATQFRVNAERALVLAEQQLLARPKDADAHYQVGTSVGLLASYSATVEGQVFAAIKLGRRAYKENVAALALDPRRLDAGLLVGVYQYLVSTRSLPVRWLSRLSGVPGNKEGGIAMIEAAAQYPGENQTDARLALVLVYNREARYDEALRVLADLQQRYPRNRLLWLEAGGTALRAGRFDDAERLLNVGLSKTAEDNRPRAFGEEALWRYKRGAVRVRLQREADATADLRAALEGEARDWVRGRAHIELGKLADVAGHRQQALHEYETAVQLARTDSDDAGETEAQHLMNHPYRWGSSQ